MSKHTPGHWFYSAKLSGSENHRGFSVLNQSGWRLAEVQPMDPDGIEGEANARLIAAAPALLEALEALLSDSENVRSIMLREAGIGMVDEVALAAARTVIAAAKGEQ